ncbi:polyhydroxyalkanoate synthesis repressor [Kiloniella spongiae]|uniref:Polyhydroxyalkanoate synthesis repressor n=1 Tax=Kiloniella spongiae TaxID=1489064 RepID=A0A0H2MJ04_9PROT|nr:polyhydroxyalkanoate synthesis repressor PhaR [Kiloniella spongiae]KLN62393.1 polyhydroxyalkanoate synthesis repressor [Kiloniella spongiae]
MATSKSGNTDDAIVIKKYANRRLYNTATSSYVTLDHLCQMVKDDVDFVVYDAKSGNDITRSVLTQIIVEEEAKGQNLLPISFLRQLISLYGDSMQWVVPKYLEHMMEGFSENQDKMRQSMQETFGGIFPFGNLDEMNKQNMALFENAMQMLSPFQNANASPPPRDEEPTKKQTAPQTAPQADNGGFDDLKTQVEQLQKQLDALSKKK